MQYFERAVFEKHPENQPPYDVLLSQLGTFQYKQKYQSAKPTPQPAPESGHTNKDADVNPRCGVAGTNFTFVGRNFTRTRGSPSGSPRPTAAWSARAARSSRRRATASSASRSRRPRSSPQFPGWWAMTWQGSYSQHQSIGWFYIARNAGECANIGGATPPPAPPTQVSGGSCDVSGTKDGSATPSSVRVGDTVTIRAFGFTPNEPLSLWFTAPNGSVVGTSSPNFVVPAEGGFTLPINTRPSADVAFGPGRWAITFEGAYSHHQSVVFFCVTP